MAIILLQFDIGLEKIVYGASLALAESCRTMAFRTIRGPVYNAFAAAKCALGALDDAYKVRLDGVSKCAWLTHQQIPHIQMKGLSTHLVSELSASKYFGLPKPFLKAWGSRFQYESRNVV